VVLTTWVISTNYPKHGWKTIDIWWYLKPPAFFMAKLIQNIFPAVRLRPSNSTGWWPTTAEDNWLQHRDDALPGASNSSRSLFLRQWFTRLTRPDLFYHMIGQYSKYLISSLFTRSFQLDWRSDRALPGSSRLPTVAMRHSRSQSCRSWHQQIDENCTLIDDPAM